MKITINSSLILTKDILMKTLKYILFFSFIFAFQACTKDLQQLNENPAGFADLDPSYQLTKVQAGLAGDREDVWRYDLLVASPMVQHLAGAWGTQAGGMYQIMEKAYWTSHWEATYPRELKNIQDIVDKTSGVEEQTNIHAAARILRIFIYAKLTDLYGDIPYSEAIKGFSEGKFLPKYDKQEDIYADFFKELDEAVSLLDESKGAFQGDIFYNGDVSQWKKFGNSLRLRLGFRIANVDPAESKKQVEAALAGGVMTSNADIAMTKHMPISYSEDELRGNGRSQVFHVDVSSTNFRLVNTLVDFMSERQDPRLDIYGRAYYGTGIIGVSKNIKDITDLIEPLGMKPGGLPWVEAIDYGVIKDSQGNDVINPQDGQPYNVDFMTSLRQPSTYVSALDAPSFHLTYAEVELLKAEAALRGWGGLSDPQQYFNKGVEASCEMMSFYPGAPTIAASAIEDLKDYYDPFPTDFEEAMDAIHGQMWVNFFLNGTEAYANYRRTKYPSQLVPFSSLAWYTSETDGVMPKRFFYPTAEFIQNPTSLQEAIDRLGGKDDWLKPVWWDVK